MRRGAAEPMLAVDPARAPAFARVERGARGLRLTAHPAPEGATLAPAEDLVIESAAPVALRAATLVAGGAWVLGLGALGGVAYSIGVPRIRVVHDRRPPGVDRVAGAHGVNAGLLHDQSGWRAVVLPSLGDVAAGLGAGPAALRADGRRVALVHEGAVHESDLGVESEGTRHEAAADLLAYAGPGSLWAAAGAAVGPIGTPSGDGEPVVALAGAAGVDRVAALHADGEVSVWEAGGAGPLARWRPPCGAQVGAIAMSADGERVELGVPEGPDPCACIVRAGDGALVRRVVGARVIAANDHQDGLFIAGDWGCAWLIAVPEPKE
jgi:hypothetical protein